MTKIMNYSDKASNYRVEGLFAGIGGIELGFKNNAIILKNKYV